MLNNNITIIALLMKRSTLNCRKWLKSATSFCMDFKSNRKQAGLLQHAYFGCNISWDCNKLGVTVNNSVDFFMLLSTITWDRWGLLTSKFVKQLTIQDVYYVMKDFCVYNWLLSYDPLKISVIIYCKVS